MKEIPNDNTFRERFFAKIDEIKKNDDSCWVWTRSLTSQGYGAVRTSAKNYTAHRVSYRFFVGKLRKGFVIDHICSNRKCVNPKHLQQVTIYKNIQLEFDRFPHKKPIYKHKNTSLLPQKLIKGHCIHGHKIKSFSDMRLAGKVWKCKKCSIRWNKISKQRKMLQLTLDPPKENDHAH